MARAFLVCRLAVVVAVSLAAPVARARAAGDAAAPKHATRAESLLIRDVMVIRGNGTPPTGPTDVLVRGNKIEKVGRAGPSDAHATVIDGKGKWLLPGFFNLHGHIQEERGGLAIENEYQFNLWLACGITAVRDVGSEFERSLVLRQQSRDGTLAAPRFWIYPFLNNGKPDALRAQVRDLAARGADGLKLFSMDRDALDAVVDEAKRLKLPTTIHMGVEETTVLDCVRLGMTSIEHWYGVPDAALIGLQRFPPDFSYSNEVDRFRYAGRLWREADPAKLEQVLARMVAAELAWDPTLAIYEASRDLTRAQNQPWFRDHLHPGLARFFEPNLDSHGSFFIGWSSTDEAFWRENYRIWMAAVKRFADLGGTVTCGEDAGFIYEMYGFGYLRELELHEEAGFTPLEVVTQATLNGARVVGVESQLGRIKEGWLADLVLVNGNPLDNLRLLYPTGADVNVDGRPVHAGGIEWTIKDGIPYHGPTLMERVRAIVAEARRAPKPAAAPTGGAGGGASGSAGGCCAGGS
ncbi:MAG: amidohydrolase family protein [Planctomycetes bacterium]|nr:amidohydrolase family protein [Planctomycetota bacterium]